MHTSGGGYGAAFKVTWALPSVQPQFSGPWSRPDQRNCPQLFCNNEQNSNWQRSKPCTRYSHAPVAVDSQRGQPGRPPKNTIILQFQPDHLLPTRQEVWNQARRFDGLDSVRTGAQQKRMVIEYQSAAEAAKVR